MGGTPGGVKEWGAWLAEKVSRFKLKHGSADGLGTFEALEFLVIGIHGKVGSLAGDGGGCVIRFALARASIFVSSLPAPKTNIKR